MISTVTLPKFRDAFTHAGRKDQFSYEALELLFDYLEESNPNTELDVVALCCEFSERSSNGVIEDHAIDVEGLDDDEKQKLVSEYLEEKTTLVGRTDAGFVFVNF